MMKPLTCGIAELYFCNYTKQNLFACYIGSVVCIGSKASVIGISVKSHIGTSLYVLMIQLSASYDCVTIAYCYSMVCHDMHASFTIS